MSILPLAIVNAIYRSFICFELVIHFFGFAATLFFFVIFFRSPVFHTNLRWVLYSFCASFALTSLMRTILCIFHMFFLEALQASSNTFLSKISDFFLRARDTCLYAGALHMLLLAGERLLATAKSKTYENERHHLPFLIVIIIMWSASIIMMFFLKNGKLTQYLFAALYAVSDLASIVLMIIVYRLNYSNIVLNQGTLDISHGYQVRENVSTSKLLNRIFIAMVLMTFSGLASYFGYLYYNDPLIVRCFGFLFDTTVALPTLLVPTMLLAGNERMCKEVKRFLRKKKGRPSPVGARATNHFVDFQGRKVQLKVDNEQEAYFTLYQAQWECPNGKTNNT